MAVFGKMFGRQDSKEFRIIEEHVSNIHYEEEPLETLNETAIIFNGKKMSKEDFELLKTVGKGAFGAVYQVRLKETNQIYAMKVLNKEFIINRQQYDHILTERKVLEDVHHPFLVSLRYAFQSNLNLYLVFDFFNGGELYFHITRGKFSEIKARFYSGEIILGLEYLHDRGIVYRDLKPENILLDSDGHIRITDFGLSKDNIVGDNARSLCGTPEYLAPEVIKREPYGFGVDWWSLGILIYEMINGIPPFYDINRQRMYKKIMESPVKKTQAMSDEVFKLVSSLLNKDPTMRLGVNGAADIKSDVFYHEIDWNKLYNKEVNPPFMPNVVDNLSTGNFEKEFTNETPFIAPTPADAKLVDPDAFTGFSYAPEYATNEEEICT